MSLNYLQYDVFTDEPLAGNQLAVFLDGRGLSDERMQRMAREMNFSESTFILPAESADTGVRMRIFTPGSELPIAGHPTIGSSFALAHAGVIAPGLPRFVFGLGVGPVPVDLEWDGSQLRFVWMTQLNPTFGAPLSRTDAVARCIGLSERDLAPGLPIQSVSCGVPFLMIPLRDAAAVDRASSDGAAYRRLQKESGNRDQLFLFAVTGPSTAHSRMFAPEFNIIEDPATGIASGPLGCYLVEHKLVDEANARQIVSMQGVAMGRPSRIHIEITGGPGAITQVRVGGRAVLVARGEFLV